MKYWHVNGWQILDRFWVIGDRRDDKPDPHRSGPDSPARGRLSGTGQPAAHSRPHRAAAGRLHRGRTDDGCQPGAPARAGVRAAGVPVGGGYPLRRGPGPRAAQAQGPYPQGGDPPDHPRDGDHLGARRIGGRAAAGHVARRGGDARDHPRRLGTDGRGPAAALRPADGTAAAGADLGRVTDRPGRRDTRRAGLPCRRRQRSLR